MTEPAPRPRRKRRLLLGLVVLVAAALLLFDPSCDPDPQPPHVASLLEALSARAAPSSLADRWAWWRGARRLARGRATPCELTERDGAWRLPLEAAGWRTVLQDDFSGYEPEAPWQPRTPLPADAPRWTTLWRGCAGPCDEVEGVRATASTDPGGEPGQVLSLRPAPPDHDGVTRSTFVASTAPAVGPLLLQASLRTDAQLRQAPNPWETGWLFWRLAEDLSTRAQTADPADLCGRRHGLYLALKTNGWELGKFGPGYAAGLTRDPAAGGCQRFLASGDSPRARPGHWQRVCVLAIDDRFAAWVDGEPLVGAGTWQDRDDTAIRAGRPEGEPLYSSGAIGLYTEDAAVSFTDLRLFAPL